MQTLGKILVIGSGGREHALALALLVSPSVAQVLVLPGNAGTSSAPTGSRGSLRNVTGDPLDVARAERPDLVVVGPELPLVDGLVDRLTQAGFVTFGPSRAAARLEGEKAFMKELAVRLGIPTPRHVVVRGEGDLAAALGSFATAPVVKANGLCAGKGVVVAESHDEAARAARGMLSGAAFGDAGRVVLLEERVSGSEASVHALCDGERFLILPAAQDHKRIGDGDTGPNTGGMGTYAPAPLVTPAIARKIEQNIVRPTLAGMAELGHPFRGVLFAGVMVTAEGEPVLLEFNVRFGDPETQVLCGVLDGDLAAAFHQAARGELAPDALRVADRHAICVVLAAAGYPGTPEQGVPIEGLDAAASLPGVRVYHAGTRLDAGRVVTAGGRVLGVTAQAASLAEAHARAYRAVDAISFSGMQVRRDIARRALG